MKLLLVEFLFFWFIFVFKGSNCAITNKANSSLLNNLDVIPVIPVICCKYFMKNNLYYSLLIFSVILEENLQVTNDKLSLLR